MIVLRETTNPVAVKALLNTGFALDPQHPNGNTILQDTVQWRILECDLFTSVDDAYPSSKVSYQDCNRASLISVLLQHSVDPNAQNNIGDTTLHAACRSERKAYDGLGPALKAPSSSLCFNNCKLIGQKSTL